MNDTDGLDLQWSTTPYVVLDTETTGFSGNDRICEITVAICQGGKILDEVTRLVNPGIRIPAGATAVHGITDEDVADAPRFVEIADSVLALMRTGAPWVAHHLAFDLRMLTYDLGRGQLPRGVPTLCTLDYSRLHHPSLSAKARHRLIDIAGYFDLPHGGLHRSRADVELLSRVVPRLVGDLTVGETMTKWSQEW